jgi:hypothetical protein
LVGELEDKFVPIAGVSYSCAESREIDGMECGNIPMVDGVTLVEEVGLGCGFPDVVLVVAGDCFESDAELDLGRGGEGDGFLESRGVAEVKSSCGFVGIYIELSS